MYSEYIGLEDCQSTFSGESYLCHSTKPVLSSIMHLVSNCGMKEAKELTHEKRSPRGERRALNLEDIPERRPSQGWGFGKIPGTLALVELMTE